jgi:TonB family protein
MSDLALGNLWAWAVQVAAIAALGLLLPVLVRLTSPGARLVYLRGLLLACLVLPLLQPWVPLEMPTAQVPVALTPFDSPEANEIGVAVSASSSRAAGKTAQTAWPWSLEQTLLGIAVGGALARFAWLGLGLWSLRRLRRRSRPLNPVPDPVDDARLAVGASAGLLVCDAVARPVTFGFRRPVVIVPEDYLELAPDEQLTIAMHELLHVRRRDWVRTLGDEVVRSILWFHPAIWWLVDQIHLGIEQVVDREVVRLSGARRPYLEALLKIAASRPVPLLRPASMFLKQRHLAQRVASLVKEASMSRVRLVASFTAVSVLLITSGYFVVQAYPLRSAFEPIVLPDVPAAVTTAAAPPLTVPPPPPSPPAKFVLSGAVIENPTTKTTLRADRMEVTVGEERGAQQQQTRPVVDPKQQAPRPGMMTQPPPPPAPPKVDEATARARIQASPSDPMGYLVLGILLDEQKRFDEAEENLLRAKALDPTPVRSLLALARHYNRSGEFEKCIEALKERFALEPANPEAPYTIATYYWDKAYRDHTLSDNDKNALVAQGLIAVDDALRLKPDYMEALTYKNLLIRLLATLTTDPVRQQALIAQADKYRDQAIAIRNKGFELPPDAVRVGGNVAPPRKIRDVKPEYPAAALDARVAGVVIVEALIGADGKVVKARVLRSIPLLDQAALDAVKQWEWEPTLLNGAAVPVVITATVNFMPSAGSGAIGEAAIPPPPPPPPPAKAGSAASAVAAAKDAADPWYPPSIQRVGGSVQPPRKVVDVRAVYPQEAQDANVQGVVIIEIVVGTDGKVTQARVLRSIPMLDQAALDAVKQWEFTPTVLNGMLVPVVMTVTVNFTLQ